MINKALIIKIQSGAKNTLFCDPEIFFPKMTILGVIFMGNRMFALSNLKNDFEIPYKITPRKVIFR
jgi:hypothetical protein